MGQTCCQEKPTKGNNQVQSACTWLGSTVLIYLVQTTTNTRTAVEPPCVGSTETIRDEVLKGLSTVPPASQVGTAHVDSTRSNSQLAPFCAPPSLTALQTSADTDSNPLSQEDMREASAKAAEQRANDNKYRGRLRRRARQPLLERGPKQEEVRCVPHLGSLFSS